MKGMFLDDICTAPKKNFCLKRWLKLEKEIPTEPTKYNDLISKQIARDQILEKRSFDLSCVTIRSYGQCSQDN